MSRERRTANSVNHPTIEVARHFRPAQAGSRRIPRRVQRRRLALEPLETRRLLVGEIEPNDSFATATAFTGTDVLTGQIQRRSDVDHFSIAAAAGDQLQFRVSTNGDSMPSFDASMELINATGDVLASAMDSHSISFQVSIAGTYALRLTSQNTFGPFVGAYSIQATVAPFSGVVESESNNDIASANAIAGQNNIRGSLASASDVDVFSIPMQAGQAIAINFAEAPDRSPAARLLNASGSVIAQGRDGLGLAATVATTGTYFVSISADNTQGTVTGAYTAQLLVSTTASLDAERGDDLYAATPIDLGPGVIPSQYLATTSTFVTQGLTGSYVNQSLRGTAAQTDWRTTQTVAGTRVDPTIHFSQSGWGTRSTVGLTGGNDNDWDTFSVQWDGFVRIVTPGTQLYLSSDDGSRMWIDINRDGSFDASGAEFVNNRWGQGQGNTLSPSSVALAAGDYRIRVQYEEGNGGNVAYLMWSDSDNSASSAVSLNTIGNGMGVLDSLSDVDTFALDLSGTGLYEFSLDSTTGGMGWQSRVMTLYNEYGQVLDYSHNGFLNTTGWNTRVERTSRYFVSVQATSEAGLGAYKVVPRVAGEFPRYRDVPLYYQNYDNYSKQEQVPAFMAFFESRYDIYQVDLTRQQPNAGVEYVAWQFSDPAGSGCGGSQGGGYGNRRPSGSGSGTCDADWTRLSDIWFGLFYHENGHGVGLFHARHPLNTMSYGGQYDFLPIGSFNWMGLNGNGDARVSNTRLFNMRDYLDWALESGRIVLESESNDTPLTAQSLSPYIAEMSADAETRNDQVVVVGSIHAIDNVDYYRLTVNAGDMISLDIDSAEFQTALDATLDVIDAQGNVLATSQGGIDRNSGLVSADPSLNFEFTTAGDYYIRVRGEAITTGYYRLKVSPEPTLDANGPRIVGAWPDGGQTIDSTRQLTFWTNDQLDPATLNSSNFVVRGASTGVHSGTATFDPFTSILTWVADAPLPIDNYTVTLRGGAGGVTDLQGNLLDGETGGVLAFPSISGNGSRGGDFVTTFVVDANDSAAAVFTGLNYYRQNHERDLLDIFFSDELDVTQVNQANYTLRGAGTDRSLGTADDTFAPVDVMYDPMQNMSSRLLRVYTRGMLPPDNYRIEATLRDASGLPVNLSQVFQVAMAVPSTALSTTAAGTTNGLEGSYVNSSLRSYATQDDWRNSQTIVGTRVDEVVDFTSDSFGVRSQVNITGGSDANWDDFSVQWDGYITIPANGVRLFTRSDDGSRMWIDINNDGVFNSSGNEIVDNNWGNGQGVTTGPASAALNAGTYRIRIQYEEGGGGNRMSLLWDYPDAENTNDGLYSNLKIVDVNVQPNSVVDQSPASINVTFNELVSPVSLTTSAFRLIYSPDADFFDDNDQIVGAANNRINWNPRTRTASLVPGASLTAGYYMLELDGDQGGVVSLGGRSLDGEYRDGYIVGGTDHQAWSDTPSGDGIPGGDYRAIFILAQPSVSLGVAGADSIVEGAGVATVEARLSFASLYPVTVEVEFSGQAELGTDYTVGSTLLTIPAGSLSASTTISALQDILDEFDEQVVVGIKAVTNAIVGPSASTTVTIVDANAAPTFSLSVDGSSLAEGGGTRTVTATLSARTEKEVQIVLGLAGAATRNVDYTIAPSVITIPAGQLTASAVITATQDLIDEVDESLAISVASATNATNPTNQTLSLSIIDDDVPPTFSMTVDKTSIEEAGGVVNVIATLSAISSRIVTIPLTYAGTASSGDYSGRLSQLIIPAGAASAQVQLVANQDAVDELAETVIVTAGVATNATAGASTSVTVSIVDDDPAPLVTLFSNSLVNEATNIGVISAELSAPSALPVRIELRRLGGSAVPDEDYTMPTTSLLIEAGSTYGEIYIHPIDDSIYERPEDIVFGVADLENAIGILTQPLVITILNDDAAPRVTFSVSQTDVDEGVGELQLVATLDRLSAASAIIDLSTVGSATLGVDYLLPNNRIEIPANSLSGSTTLTILQDLIDEPNEVIQLGIADSEDVDIVGAVWPDILLADDDAPPEIQLSFDHAILNESSGITNTVLRARLSSISTNQIVANLQWSGTAAAGIDFNSVPFSFVIPAGVEEATFALVTLPDALFEGPETINVAVTSATNATVTEASRAQTVIQDDDQPPVLTMTPSRNGVLESNSSMTIALQLSFAAAVEVIVGFTSEGTALLGSDFNFPSQVTIPAFTSRVDVPLNILQDAIDEIDETIIVRIGQLSNATGNGQASVTILDDESFTISIDLASISESGGLATATVERRGSDLSQGVVVMLQSLDSSELSVPTSVTIEPLETTASFMISAVDDSLFDGTQTATILASAPNMLDATASIQVTDLESLSLTIHVDSLNERGPEGNATLRRENTNLDLPLTVSLIGTWAGLLQLPSAVTIPAGSANLLIPMIPIDNFLLTGTQSVSVRAEAEGYSPGIDQVEIADDELLRPYTNPRNRLDVNADGNITPFDILLIINHLNREGPGILPPPVLPFTPTYYPDTSLDNSVTPIDILLIINYLRAVPAAEGERIAVPADQFFADLDLMGNHDEWVGRKRRFS